MRNNFDKQLKILNQELCEMGALIENAISNAVKALTENNKELANAAIEFDRQVDEKEKEIESLCLKLLLKQQPVARDLRLISSALKMITDMERIGDQASDIAEIAISGMKDKEGSDSSAFSLCFVSHIPQMAAATIGMVNDCIDAFIRKDIDVALKVIKDDDNVDRLFRLVRRELLEIIIKNPAIGSETMDCLMVAKYFERIGDHAENIAEWVVFSITGEHKIS